MTKIAPQHLEINVRVTQSNGVSLDATIFPLPSHKEESPIDQLAGFLNKRRGEFFVVRLADDSEMLLPLSKCYIFELSHQAANLLLAVHPFISPMPVTSNPRQVVSYAPIVLTLVNDRYVRGNMWFYDFEPEDERNVVAGLNRGLRYVCVHGDKSTFFVRRESILKVNMQAESYSQSEDAQHTPARPDHVTNRSELVNLSDFNDFMEQYIHGVESEQAPAQVGQMPTPPKAAPPVATPPTATPPVAPPAPSMPSGGPPPMPTQAPPLQGGPPGGAGLHAPPPPNFIAFPRPSSSGVFPLPELQPAAASQAPAPASHESAPNIPLPPASPPRVEQETENDSFVEDLPLPPPPSSAVPPNFPRAPLSNSPGYHTYPDDEKKEKKDGEEEIYWY